MVWLMFSLFNVKTTKPRTFVSDLQKLCRKHCVDWTFNYEEEEDEGD